MYMYSMYCRLVRLYVVTKYKYMYMYMYSMYYRLVWLYSKYMYMYMYIYMCVHVYV